MALLIAILLAVFLLPAPWNAVLIVLAALWEIATAVFGLWYSRRGRPQVGAETLVGREAEVITRCAPVGQVKLDGEIWAARCDSSAEVGETVRVRSVDGLTLLVDRGEAPS
jgi:membrane-bound serine protease (ClpP class)